MSKASSGVPRRKRVKKILKLAKGARFKRSKNYKRAKETVQRGLVFAYRDRRVRKREFRALWITRINAAARAQGITYSRFMEGLRKANVSLDRKVLADMAVNDAEGFADLVRIAKEDA